MYWRVALNEFKAQVQDVRSHTFCGEHISGQKMHDRLKAQNLIHERLLGRYDDLHTQSFEWVVDDTVTALKNWEAGE